MSITQRYQVNIRLLTQSERFKEVQKEVYQEIEIEKPLQNLQLNNNNNQILTISDANSSSNGIQKSQNSQDDLVEIIASGKRQFEQAEKDKGSFYKRRKLDDMADQRTDFNSESKLSHQQESEVKKNQNCPALSKIDFTAELKKNNLMDQLKAAANQNGHHQGPSSLQVELGSNSKTNVTTEELIIDDLKNNPSPQEDIESLLFMRSPLMPEEMLGGSPPNINAQNTNKNQEQQVVMLSQDYHQSLLNFENSNQSPSQAKNKENDKNFQLNDALLNHSLEEEKVQSQERYLRKRDLKHLEKEQQKQQKESRDTETFKQLEKKLITETIFIDENIHISVKDLDTMNEFEKIFCFEPKNLQKLAKWVKSGKYTCQEHVTDDRLTLKIKIFTFELQAKLQDDCQAILNEIKLLKNERKQINKDISLFQFYVMNLYNEKNYRLAIDRGISNTQLQKYVDNPEHLFIQKEALGIRDYKHGYCSYQLAFTEEMCFDEEPQRYPSIYSDKLLIYSKGGAMGELQVCPLKRRELIVDHTDQFSPSSLLQQENKMFDADSIRKEKYKYRYYVALPVRDNEEYSVYFPRLF
eukprot:403345661